MELSLINIGNSRGIRLKKSWIELLGFKEKLEVQIKKDELVIRPKKESIRKNWSRSAKKISLQSNPMLTKEFSNQFDKEEPAWSEQ